EEFAGPPQYSPKASAVRQVHQLAPVKLRVLENSGLLAPLRVIVPELVTHMRQLQPRIYYDALAVAGLDQPFQICIPFAVRLEEVPRCHMQSRNSRPSPARRESLQIDARAIRMVEKCP